VYHKSFSYIFVILDILYGCDKNCSEIYMDITKFYDRRSSETAPVNDVSNIPVND